MHWNSCIFINLNSQLFYMLFFYCYINKSKYFKSNSFWYSLDFAEIVYNPHFNIKMLILHKTKVFLSRASFIYLKQIPYSMFSNPLNDRHLPKFVRGLDNGDLLFLKIFQNFLKFYNFIQKVQLEGCFIITSSYLNRKDKQK